MATHHNVGRHDLYVDGELVDRWDCADVDAGWIEITEAGGPPALARTTRRRGRVELIDRVTGRVTRAEREDPRP